MAGSLARFRDAQDAGETYERALAELRDGRKRTHWMWFVFPQLAGLGHSEMSRLYALDSMGQAREYLADPVLGPRLRACASALLAQPGASAERILGPVDALKLRSSMTLFARADPEEALFAEVLDRYYGGEPDARTQALLGEAS
jgi:uncharacterized protein (DUF1810 family)